MPGGRAFHEDPEACVCKAGGILPLRLHMLTTLHVHQDVMRSCHAHRASFCCLASGGRCVISRIVLANYRERMNRFGDGLCAPREIMHVLWPVSICLLSYLKLESGIAHFMQAGRRQHLHDRFAGTLLIGARIPHKLLEHAFHLIQALRDVHHLSLDVPQGLIRLVKRRNDLAP
jgi:hypothetical protein